MTPFEKLIRHFERFPGIGSRQARRFAFHILTLGFDETRELTELIGSLRNTVAECSSCHRFFSRPVSNTTLCTTCSDGTRDHTKLTVVERDSDIDAIERSNVYDGLYFVLGGTVPLLDTQDTKKVRGSLLKQLVTERTSNGLKEIILGFAVNPDGENTARYITMLLKEITDTYSIRISHLGRGLSTGSELEYADPETIKNALKNRG